jgi:gliding motility-associated-like protein
LEKRLKLGIKTCFLSLTILLGSALCSQNTVGSGNALNFTGTEEVDVGSDYSTMSLPLSISVWIKPNANGPQSIFYSSDNSNVYQGWWFQVSNSGNLAIAYGDGAGGNSFAFSRVGRVAISLQPNKWCHLAAVVRGPTDMDIYFNGQALNINYVGSGGALATNTTTGVIGLNPRNNNTLNAQLDELSIWDRALTVTEIRDLMCAKLAGNEPGLRGYYRFDATTGNTLTDFGPNGNNGTLQNNPAWVASGAPVGDRSTWNYNPSGSAIGFSPAIDSVVAKLSGTGNDGIHLYFVDQLPTNPPTALSIPTSVNHYLGVFTADPQQNFDLEYFPAPPNTTPNAYGLARRDDNAAQVWSVTVPRNNPAIVLPNRSSQEQYILAEFCPPLNPFPADTVACDSVVLSLPNTYTNITWSNNSTGNSATFTSSGPAGFTATVNGCPTGDTVNVTIIDGQNLALLPPDTLICNGLRATLSAFDNSVTDYQWSTGATDSAITIFTPGIYWVQVFFGSNCSFRDSVTVTFSNPTEPIAQDRFRYCEGSPVPLSIDGSIFNTVAWSNGSTSRQTTYTSTGKQWVQATKFDGCVSSDTFFIDPAVPLDSLNIFSDTTFCAGSFITFKAPDTLSVTWPNGSDSTYRVNQPQTVRVRISDGCTESTQFVEIRQTSCECDVQMPNAFTPNGDGLNDVFKPATVCEYQLYDLRILDRWGQEVFYTQSPGVGFDGTFEGKLLPGGVYVYKFKFSNGLNEGSRTGSFTLIR